MSHLKIIAMSRGYNFGAGPAMLPESILEKTQEELLDWQHSGMSVMEIGHRSKEFGQLLEEAEQNLRLLLTIPPNYHVLFLGMAARLQFAMVALNFLSEHEEAGYLITGVWSSLAYKEASKLKKAYCVASSEAGGGIDFPALETWNIKKNSRYIYLTNNETVNGVRCPLLPRDSSLAVIADMTSSLLTEPIKVQDYALIFAGVQKNIANAGMTLVIVRDEFLKTITNDNLATMLDYRTHCREKSLYATPPTFNCYIAAQMFQWVKNQGGITQVYSQNRLKSSTLYDYIDSSNFYYCPVAKKARSLVNVCFTTSNRELDDHFVAKAEQQGLYALRGHRSIGGLRASLYNAMPLEAVECLIKFMKDFAKDAH